MGGDPKPLPLLKHKEGVPELSSRSPGARAHFQRSQCELPMRAQMSAPMCAVMCAQMCEPMRSMGEGSQPMLRRPEGWPEPGSRGGFAAEGWPELREGVPELSSSSPARWVGIPVRCRC